MWGFLKKTPERVDPPTQGALVPARVSMSMAVIKADGTRVEHGKQWDGIPAMVDQSMFEEG